MLRRSNDCRLMRSYRWDAKISRGEDPIGTTGLGMIACDTKPGGTFSHRQETVPGRSSHHRRFSNRWRLYICKSLVGSMTTSKTRETGTNAGRNSLAGHWQLAEVGGVGTGVQQKVGSWRQTIHVLHLKFDQKIGRVSLVFS